MKIISLFCGCGGMDLGFVKAGHEIVFANDHDKDSIESYKNYFCKKLGLDENHVLLDDIENLKIENIPEGDVIIGGFPCQGFSIANKFRHEKDERNKLYLEMLRIIKGKKPKYFVAENVAGLCSLGGYETPEDKKNKLGKVLKMIISDFEEAGYNVKYKILNSANYGVPQSRRRVIILGTRKDINKQLIHPEETHNKENWRLLKHALEGIPEPDEEHNLLNHIGTQHKVRINGHIGNRKLDINKPSPTVTGRGGKTGGPVIMPHPNLKRRMTVREYARIQEFPDDFEFIGSKSSGYCQIGNAVPWRMAKAIAEMLNFEKEN